MAATAPLQYGDEKWLLNETIGIVKLLYGALYRVAYDWPELRKIAQSYADSCWNNVKINPAK